MSRQVCRGVLKVIQTQLYCTFMLYKTLELSMLLPQTAVIPFRILRIGWLDFNCAAKQKYPSRALRDKKKIRGQMASLFVTVNVFRSQLSTEIFLVASNFYGDPTGYRNNFFGCQELFLGARKFVGCNTPFSSSQAFSGSQNNHLATTLIISPTFMFLGSPLVTHSSPCTALL